MENGKYWTDQELGNAIRYLGSLCFDRAFFTLYPHKAPDKIEHGTDGVSILCLSEGDEEHQQGDLLYMLDVPSFKDFDNLRKEDFFFKHLKKVLENQD